MDNEAGPPTEEPVTAAVQSESDSALEAWWDSFLKQKRAEDALDAELRSTWENCSQRRLKFAREVKQMAELYQPIEKLIQTVLESDKAHRGDNLYREWAPEKSAHSFITKLKSVLSPEELNLILSQTTEGEQMRYFYRHWCLKEAYLKAVGCGIRLPLSTVQCTLCPSGEPSVSCSFDDFASGYWKFEEHSLPGGHLAATAWFRPTPHTPFNEAPCFTEVDFTGLIEGLTRFTDAPEEAWLAFSSKPREPPSTRRVLFADE
ncbi:hypothetical protein T265_00656 [Opisthorchis viverrini]|uniref:L-aminoadipate-semialdehyde dehydrogenase-phosphopantetheinyl transferase n=1 Tax=Opisthorchis viverrini TaxID=6198 RepID=A0A075AJK6_OPIVI|nr:hypothetical protein T265_00656 [Opisthorchis viverrini]KER33549.1 hypothetical protein T265_00656 [Opisthorchis viverrini]